MGVNSAFKGLMSLIVVLKWTSLKAAILSVFIISHHSSALLCSCILHPCTSFIHSYSLSAFLSIFFSDSILFSSFIKSLSPSTYPTPISFTKSNLHQPPSLQLFLPLLLLLPETRSAIVWSLYLACGRPGSRLPSGL